MNKSDLHYFLLLSEKIDDTLSLGVVFSLVFMMENLVFIKNDLYMKKSSQKFTNKGRFSNFGMLFSKTTKEWTLRDPLTSFLWLLRVMETIFQWPNKEHENTLNIVNV